MAALEILGEQTCFAGVQGFYRHRSQACGGDMTFAVYQPPQALAGTRRPAVTYLAGLTCTPETFAVKAGAQRVAAELGLVLVMPDTSPRGAGVPGEDEAYDLGTGAGFYLDATQAPWSRHYKMETYITHELDQLVASEFPADPDAQGIFGHSMGGHGALTLHLRHPARYRSVSAFAPVSAPMQCPWGRKAFTAYLGPDTSTWRAHDASELVRERPSPAVVLIDQGDADQFLDEQLKPAVFEAACAEAGQSLELRMRAGYDHSYYFVQTFVEDHLRHHAAALAA